MDDRNVYYIAKGKTLDIVEATMAEQSKAHRRRKRILRELGADSKYVLTHGGRVTGVQFKDKPNRDLWCNADRKYAGYWRPKAAAKDLQAKFEQMTAPSADSLAKSLGVMDSLDGLRWHHGVGVRKLGGQWIVSKHETQEGDPPDAERISRARYYEMLDAEQGADKSTKKAKAR